MTQVRNKYQLSTWVEPDTRPAPMVYSPAQSELPTLAEIAMRGSHQHLARQDDDALIVARAHLLVSVGYIAAAAMTIAGLLILAAMAGLLGESIGRYVVVWIAAVGIVALVIMFANRRQQHHYSAAGIAHHDLDSRERIARHAIDTHAELLLAQWDRDHGRDH